MQPQFWLDRWASDDIRFHRTQVHPLLATHFEILGLTKGSVVLVPLCGKTLDIGWIIDQGHHVVGVELSQKAIEALFEALGLTPTITPLQQGMHYQALHLEVFVGNIFELAPHLPSTIDAIYDRAALIALPPPMREHYTELLALIQAPQLLIGREGECGNPPFCVDEGILQTHYGTHYICNALSRIPSSHVSAQEVAWHLQPKASKKRPQQTP